MGNTAEHISALPSQHLLHTFRENYCVCKNVMKKLQKPLCWQYLCFYQRKETPKPNHLSVHSLSYPSIHNFSLQPLSNLGERALKELSILSQHWWNHRETTLSWEQKEAVAKHTFLNDIYTHTHTHQTGSLKNLPKLRKRENRYKNQLQKMELNKNLLKNTFSNKSRLNLGVFLIWMVAFLMKQVYFLNYFGTDKQRRLDISTEGVIHAINISSYSY